MLPGQEVSQWWVPPLPWEHLLIPEEGQEPGKLSGIFDNLAELGPIKWGPDDIPLSLCVGTLKGCIIGIIVNLK